MKVFAIVLVIACALFSVTSANTLKETQCFPYVVDEVAHRHGLTEFWEKSRQKVLDLVTLYERCYQLKGEIANICEKRYDRAIGNEYGVFYKAAYWTLTYVQEQDVQKDLKDTLRRICLA